MWWISECRWWVFIRIHNREFAYLLLKHLSNEISIFSPFRCRFVGSVIQLSVIFFAVSFEQYKHLWIISIKSSFSLVFFPIQWSCQVIQWTLNRRWIVPYKTTVLIPIIIIVCPFWLETEMLWIIISLLIGNKMPLDFFLYGAENISCTNNEWISNEII